MVDPSTLYAVARGGLADLRRMPSTTIDEGPQRTVSRYRTEGRRRGAAPVLLVPPLAAPATCFDLRRGCSLAEHLVQAGRRTYLLDYGPIEFAHRELGLEHWVDDVIPAALRAVSADAGGRPVRVIGWCLGGIMALLAHAADRELPVRSIALVASPWDVSKVPLVAPLRPIDAMTRGSLVRRGYQLAGFEKYVMKPWTVLSNLGDRDLLAQIEAVDDFMGAMHAYPGRTFGQLYHQVLRTNDLADGRLELGGREIDLAEVAVPLLAIAGRGDGIAPVPACHHLGDLVDGVRLETAPGGHLGVLTGRAARATTWAMLHGWLDRRRSV
jgi:polyhydroxyalkanoate synthase